MEFQHIKLLHFFTIETELGKAYFMKTDDLYALCINSQNGSYQRNVKYIILKDQKVKL